MVTSYDPGKSFYDAVRGPVFSGSIPQEAIETIQFILKYAADARVSSLSEVAVLLATSVIEVGHKMQPVREGFAKTDAVARAHVARLFQSGRISRDYAIEHTETGLSYYGRGIAQITHYENYVKLGEALNIRLELDPDRLLELHYSVLALVIGMRDGLYTGHKLSDYHRANGGYSWQQSRRIINGDDRAQEHAELSKAFYSALKVVYPKGLPNMATTKDNTPLSRVVNGLAGAMVSVPLAEGIDTTIDDDTVLMTVANLISSIMELEKFGYGNAMSVTLGVLVLFCGGRCPAIFAALKAAIAAYKNTVR
ncbi:hypothetical protein PsAD13_01948 [Pseudovibrio sp. Ad13]|uniref:hypothetical protein n=1 Tax=Pseudovibrio sp. Ad13 TaxID=989396 RepID=UPI0007AEBEFC|nr:hypothetical protein [Pseudovibrio sp. Ad13]KZK84484.1 hypothetical protein PsAD13_01948 [Pseudovibrio sp. Ad13]